MCLVVDSYCRFSSFLFSLRKFDCCKAEARFRQGGKPEEVGEGEWHIDGDYVLYGLHENSIESRDEKALERFLMEDLRTTVAENLKLKVCQSVVPRDDEAE